MWLVILPLYMVYGSTITYTNIEGFKHDVECIVIDYDMSYLVLIHNEAEIFKRSSEAGGGESCIVEKLCMVL